MGDVRRIDGDRDEVALTLDDLAREGARRMIAAALEAEVDSPRTERLRVLGRSSGLREGRAASRYGTAAQPLPNRARSRPS
jgi:hypothetical protein